MLDWLPFHYDRFWLWIGAVLYASAFTFALIHLLRERKHPRLPLLVIILTGFVAQTTGLYLRGLEVGSCPLGNYFEVLQFIVWSLVIIYIAVGQVYRMSLLGFFTAGLAAVLGVVSLLVSDWDGVRRENMLNPNAWIEFHAALAMFSYGIFAILALTSCMYLLQNHSLKRKRTHGLYRFLPSIVELDQVNVRLLILGVGVLTTALAVGSFYWMQNTGVTDWTKLTVTLGIWLAYLILLTLRLNRRVVAHHLAWSCIALFIIALFSIWPVTASRGMAMALAFSFHG